MLVLGSGRYSWYAWGWLAYRDRCHIVRHWWNIVGYWWYTIFNHLLLCSQLYWWYLRLSFIFCIAFTWLHWQRVFTQNFHFLSDMIFDHFRSFCNQHWSIKLIVYCLDTSTAWPWILFYQMHYFLLMVSCDLNFIDFCNSFNGFILGTAILCYLGFSWRIWIFDITFGWFLFSKANFKI